MIRLEKWLKKSEDGFLREFCRIHAEDDFRCCFFAPPQVTPQVWRMLNVLKGEMTRDEIQNALDLKDRKSFRERYLLPALTQGLIEMTIPDKPNSRLQKYRLTEKARSRFHEAHKV